MNDCYEWRRYTDFGHDVIIGYVDGEGKKVGCWKKWWVSEYSSPLEYRLHYKDDKLHGVCEYFREDGSVDHIATYKEGELDGLYKEFYYDDLRRGGWTCGYYEKGKKNGLWTTYLAGGVEVASKGYYKDDKKAGHWMEFFHFTDSSDADAKVFLKHMKKRDKRYLLSFHAFGNYNEEGNRDGVWVVCSYANPKAKGIVIFENGKDITSVESKIRNAKPILHTVMDRYRMKVR